LHHGRQILVKPISDEYKCWNGCEDQSMLRLLSEEHLHNYARADGGESHLSRCCVPGGDEEINKRFRQYGFGSVAATFDSFDRLGQLVPEAMSYHAVNRASARQIAPPVHHQGQKKMFDSYRGLSITMTMSNRTLQRLQADGVQLVDQRFEIQGAASV
jgi:hypothetical protein